MTEATATTTVKCLVCRRALKSAKSIAAGMGPTCARKAKAAAAMTVSITIAPTVESLKAEWLAAEARTFALKNAHREGQAALADVMAADDAQYAAYRAYAAAVTAA